jgi:hypothetical protein
MSQEPFSSQQPFSRPGKRDEPYVITDGGSVVVNVEKLLTNQRAKDLGRRARAFVEGSRKKK